MSDQLHLVVRGSVIQRLRNKGLEDLKIEAFDHPPSASPVKLGEATSGPLGAFEITLDATLGRAMLDAGRGVGFRVSDGTTVVLETADDLWQPSRAGVPVSLFIGQAKEEVSSIEAVTPLIEGRVKYADGLGVVGALVRLRHYANLGMDPRDLAVTLTDADGTFSLRYALPTGDTKDAGDPLVRVVVEIDDEEVASSTLLKSVPSTLQVVMTVPTAAPQKPNAIAALHAKISPILKDRAPRTLDPVEVGVLASTVGVSRGEVEGAVAADKLAAKLSDVGDAVEAPVVHALLKRGLSGDALSFAFYTPAALEKGWERAVSEGDLASGDVPEVGAFIAQATKVGAQQAIGTVGEPALLRKAMPSDLTENQLKAVAETWIAKARDGKLDELKTALEAHDEFSGENADKFGGVVHTFQVGDLTAWNVPVLKKLRAESTSLEDLAGHKQDWWEARLTELAASEDVATWMPPSVEGKYPSDRVKNYGTTLRKRADAAQPTAHMKRYVDEKADASPGVKGFFTNSDFNDFDIRYDRVDEYLAVKDPGGTVSVEDRKTLKTLQRLSKVTKDSVLLDAFSTVGITSAEDLAQMPIEALQDLIAPVAGADLTDPTAVAHAHALAVQTSLVGMSLVTGQYHPNNGAFDQGPVEVDTLFGALGGCECDQCSSVLSPAAYLVELAAYLRDAFEVSAGPTANAWDRLTRPTGAVTFNRQRREDLASTPLTCGATQTPQPHIDLVNELLERLVPTSLYTYGALRMSAEAPVGDVLDPYVSPGSAFPPLQRPDATAAELAAYPQETWYPAYRILAQPGTRAAFTLPFDRPTEEARLYLDDAGFPLARVMQLGVAAGEERFPTNVGWDRASALESLGMTDAEAQAFEQYPLTITDPQSAWTFGAGDGRFAIDLGPSNDPGVLASGLMRRLGLTWDELSRARAARFVGRFATSAMPNLPPTCELTGLKVSPGAAAPPLVGDTADGMSLRAAFLEGLHRFVRLQRHLGWTFEEVDLALDLFAPNPVGSRRYTFDAAVWIRLCETQSLARELRLEPIELLALWTASDDMSGQHGPLTAPLPAGSLWERAFERRAARHDSDGTFTALRNDGVVRSAPSDADPRLFTEIEMRSIASALGVRSSELKALVRTLGPDPLRARRTIVWVLWARARIARSSGLPIADACWLLDTLFPTDPTRGNVPLGDDGVRQLREFFRAASLFKQAKVPVADLAYLLGNDATVRTAARPTPAATQAALVALRQALRETVEATAPLPRTPSEEEISAGLLPALARYTTAEAAAQVLIYLDLGEALTSGSDTREALLREVLGRALWSHEVDALFAIPVNASVAAARRAFVFGRLSRLAAVPGVALPRSQSPRPRNFEETHDGHTYEHTDASNFIASTLRALVPVGVTDLVGQFVDRLAGGDALVADVPAVGSTPIVPGDEHVCDVAFGVGFYADLAGMAHATDEDINGRIDEVVRACVLRQLIVAKVFLEDGPPDADPVAEVLAGLNRPVAFTDTTQEHARELLERQCSRAFFDVIKALPADTAARRALRREYVLIALDGVRAELDASEAEVARAAFQALAEETWGRPLSAERSRYVDGFVQGVARAELSWLSAFLSTSDGLSLGLPNTLATEWAAPMSEPSDAERLARAAAWLPLSLLAFRDRLREIAFARQLVAHFAGGLGVSPATSQALLGPGALQVPDPSDPGAAARDAFVRPEFVYSEGAIAGPQLQCYERLAKAARCVVAFKLTDAELAPYGSWISRGLLDLRTLPIGMTPVAPASLASFGWTFIDTAEALSFRKLVKADDASVFDLLDAVVYITNAPAAVSADASYLLKISALTGWDYINQPGVAPDPIFGLAFSTPAYLAVSRRIRRRVAAESAASTLDVPITKLLAWVGQFAAPSGANFTTRLSATQGMREALRAANGDAAWVQRSKGLVDKLRERSRDALADFHCALKGFDDRNRLFDWLLVDTEMSCCMLTTRALFATASLQTAIQRSFMGLEAGITPRAGYAARWQWMKQYRVWEANRKVFLFPENWLDPSLRRDRTPLFQEMEDMLQQSELSDENIGKALGKYLAGLDHIARLDVRAFTFEEHKDAGGGRTLHVLARTYGSPHEYYYRRRVRGLRWTPWEKLDLQINANSHTLAMLKDRLHLFWAEVGGGSEDPQRTQANDQRDAREAVRPGGHPTGIQRTPPDAGISVRVGFSRMEPGGWTPARVSKEEQRIEWDPGWHSFMGVEYGQCPHRVGRNLALRVVAADEDDRVAASIGVMHSAYLDVDTSGRRALLTNHRATFVLRRCTGELERMPHDPLPSPSTAVIGLGYPVYFLAPSGAGHYPADDALETWDTETIPLALSVQAHPSDTTATMLEVMSMPQQRAAAFGYNGPLPYQYRLRIDHSRTVSHGLEPEPMGPSRPVVITDGFRSFLIEQEGCECEGGGQVPVQEAMATTLAIQALFSTPAYAANGAQLPSAGGGLTVVGRNSATSVDDRGTPLADAVGQMAPMQAPSEEPTGGATVPNGSVAFRVSTLYHAQSCRLLEKLDHGGFAELFSLKSQFPVTIVPRLDHLIVPSDLQETYEFTGSPLEAPTDDFDFSPGNAYGLYNWEVFFHAPFRIACMLNEDQQFERAQTWFHYIFNPFVVQADVPETISGLGLGGVGSLRRAWRFRPFFLAESGAAADDLRAMLDPRVNTAAASRARRRIAEQISVWLDNPFDPYAIATFRERAFQVAVVFRYIDNLLDWGDQLFGRGTRETIVEATHLYVLAAELLGPRPAKIRREGGNSSPPTLSAGLASGASPILPEDLAGGEASCCGAVPGNGQDVLAALGRWTGFCTPTNDQLVEHWDRVTDRLFKIRHCLNIDGVRVELPLFESPIDPALLVRAAAAGVDIGAALVDSAPSLPMFRFQLLLQRAIDFTADVRNLGGQLTAAMEKRDAEAMTRLRAEHEGRVLEASRAVRILQVNEAQGQIDVLTASKDMAQQRADYYDGKTFMNALEGSALVAQATAIALQISAQALSTTAAAAAAFPDFIFGGAGMASPVGLTMSGGKKVADSSSNASATLGLAASIASTTASTLATLGGYTQRLEDWHFQRDQAVREQAQIDRQITAATLRKTIAEREYDNLALQIANSRAVEEELRTKFTNTELYEWMARQVSSIYFRSYQMALDLARRAERAYRFERLDPSARFVAPLYWDNLKRGLLSGEQLHHDLRRMEKAYLETERRDHELTRHVSLARLKPDGLIQLRETGVCEFEVPEALFDTDYPGHYHRRIKSVSVTIPAVIGPYGGVHARLTLLSSRVRTSPNLGDGYEPTQQFGEQSDPRFVYDVVPSQSIVTSSGQSDSGLFHLDFRSEKVLPFEGAGAVSRWRLELDPLAQSFDPRTVTDVVLHMQYTARDGGAAMAQAAREYLAQRPENRQRQYLVSLAQNAPEALHAFRTDTRSGFRALMVPVLRSLTSFAPRGMRGKLVGLSAFFMMRAPNDAVKAGVQINLTEADPAAEEFEPLENPVRLLADRIERDRFAPSALVMFGPVGEGGETDVYSAPIDLEPYFDASSLRLVLTPVTGTFSVEPIAEVMDVLLLVTEVLEPAD